MSVYFTVCKKKKKKKTYFDVLGSFGIEEISFPGALCKIQSFHNFVEAQIVKVNGFPFSRSDFSLETESDIDIFSRTRMDRFEDQGWSTQFCGQKQFMAVEAFDVAKSFFVLIDNAVSCISVIHGWFVQNLVLENSVAIVHFENQVIGSNCDRFTTSSSVGDGSQWKSGGIRIIWTFLQNAFRSWM